MKLISIEIIQNILTMLFVIAISQQGLLTLSSDCYLTKYLYIVNTIVFSGPVGIHFTVNNRNIKWETTRFTVQHVG